MANRNGLISSTDVSATGAVASNFFVRKGEAIVSPLLIKSPDLTKTGTVAQNNDGTMSIGNNTTGIVKVLSDDGVSNNFLFSDNDSMEVVGLNSAVLESYNSGVKLIAGSQASVQVGNGALGRIYDTQYNTPFTFTTLVAPTGGNIEYSQILNSVVAGKYQIQLTAESPVPGSASLQMFAVDLPGSQVINFSGVEVLPASVGTDLLCMNSGYFSHDGLDSLKIEITTTGTAWTGTWEFQLVKLG